MLFYTSFRLKTLSVFQKKLRQNAPLYTTLNMFTGSLETELDDIQNYAVELIKAPIE